jgi:hypothetical protein
MEVVQMEEKHLFRIIGSDDCDCCQTNDLITDGKGEAYGCHEKNTVLTHREEDVLKRIRELSLKAQELKQQIKRYEQTESLDQEAKQRAMDALESLRTLRTQLESERIAAAEERMRLLGHAE